MSSPGMSWAAGPHEVHLPDGFTVRRDQRGALHIITETWAPVADEDELRSLVETQLALCFAHIQELERRLSAAPSPARRDTILDQYGVAVKDRLLLVEFLAQGPSPQG